MNIVYSAIFVNPDELKSKFPPVHPNEYYHHSTIEFKPKSIEDLPIGETIEMKIIGRLTNEKVDALLVDNPLSKNAYPHITLSTAEGIKPFQSNEEIINNVDKIEDLNDEIVGVCGVFNGKEKITNPNIKIDNEKEQINELINKIKKF